MNRHRDLNDAAVLESRFVRVVGEGVEARHEVREVAQKVREGRFGGGESMEELQERDVGPCSEPRVMIVSAHVYTLIKRSDKKNQ